jgi:hypothetical protein
MTALWSLLADLPLTVGHVESEQLSAAYTEMTRVTTIIRLVGLDGQDGLGEEIGGPERTPHDQLAELVPTLPLAGEWTLGSFCAHVGALDLWPEAPEWELARNFRQWAFESAALDLALRQDGRSLGQALGRSLAPVRFVSSFGLGDPPTLDGVHRRLAADATLRFKVDAERTWPRPLMEELAATGAVVTIDFKGQYGLPVGTAEEMAALYDGVLACFPDALLEDPHDLPGIGEKLRAVRERVSYDAPVTSVESLSSLPVEPGWVNVKPSRIGSLQTLFAIYAHCDAAGLPMYGGGMGELGVGRRQAQLLASLFHPDGPNDVAPSNYNLADLPDHLPRSPLVLREQHGFR